MVKSPKDDQTPIRSENNDVEPYYFSSSWSEMYDTDTYNAWLEDAREFYRDEDRKVVRRLQEIHGLTDRVAGVFGNFYSLFHMENKQNGLDTNDPDVINLTAIKCFLAMDENRIETKRSRSIDQIVLQRLTSKLDQQNQRRVAEGVTNERSYPMSEESKLDKSQLAPIFEGELDREAMAAALEAAMTDQGLSVRKAGEVSGTSAGIISSIKDQRASLDKAVEVLDQLGFETCFYVRPKDAS